MTRNEMVGKIEGERLNIINKIQDAIDMNAPAMCRYYEDELKMIEDDLHNIGVKPIDKVFSIYRFWFK